MHHDIDKWVVTDWISDRVKTSITPRLMTIHTAVTPSSDIYGPGRGPGGTYAHFYNPDNGPMRQHQSITRMAFADLHANSFAVSVEHQDNYKKDSRYWKNNSDVPPFTQNQIENDARLFAHLVLDFGLENRIATPDRMTGLGWHRLGCQGNFGKYDPSDRKTWGYSQSGILMSRAFGKICPGDRRIDQIEQIYTRAQYYISLWGGQPKVAVKETVIRSEAPTGSAMDAIVDAVIAGEYGNGNERFAKLEREGYDSAAVQDAVNKRLGSPSRRATPPALERKTNIDRVVDDVLAGKYGNGQERMTKLRAAGYNPVEVQAAVNARYGITRTPAAKHVIPDIDQMARDVIAGKYGNGEERKRRLGGYYNQVQKRVNQMLS